MRNFNIIEAEQRSPEWFAARAGNVTGSLAANVLAKIKSGEAAARRDYRYQLACERITGTCVENDFTSAAMTRGIEKEPDARARYEAETGNLVRNTGFLKHLDWRAGCSLDGDVDEFAGIIEIKCPKSATMLGYIKSGVLPPMYVPQVSHNLLITGAEWCDFIAFDDRLPAGLDYFCVRVYAADLNLAAYASEMHRFIEEVDELEQKLRSMRGAA